MQRPTRIPLFPLDVVLLPAMRLPLHIFEPRYREMTARCLNEKIEFGMVLAASNSAASVGCTAEIVQRIRDYPDGRSDILAEGRAVFRLIELIQEKAYYEGLVEYIQDGDAPLNTARDAQLLGAFQQCHLLLFGQSWSDMRPDDPATLAYRMASVLPLDAAQKQKLLETRSERDRRERVREWVDALLPALNKRETARKRAGSNGHALH